MTEIYLSQFAKEKDRLEATIALVRGLLTAAEITKETKEALILSAKEEMPDDTAHAMARLSSANSFEDLVELSQYAYLVSGQVEAEQESEILKIQRFKSMMLRPYFARIDFSFDDTQDQEAVYIGRYSVRDEVSRDIAVYDWRSPIASVFYRFGVDRAFYEAPGGRIEGEVTLKRQFEISGGRLEFFFDADVHIVDEFLRRLLSQNAAPQMKTIVETIQKDQDEVIRDQEHDLVMVQGPAGSGKTSIALHRAAYLMYQGLSGERRGGQRDRRQSGGQAGGGLSSNQIVILSPNRLFEGYISHVLPELGEQNARTVIFEEVFENMLRRPVQSKNSWLEDWLASVDPASKAMNKRVFEFKMSETFLEILDRFIYDIPRCHIPFAHAEYGGRLVMARDRIQAKTLQQEAKLPLGIRLQKTEMLIRRDIHKMRAGRLKELQGYVKAGKRHPFDAREFVRMLSIRESTAMIRRVREFTQIDIFALYRGLFQDEAAFYRLAEGLALPSDVKTILALTRERLGTHDADGVPLPCEDAAALAYLELTISGRRDYADIQQVVVDEAQDYYPLHFAVLRRLFPKARYTVLGDINQTMERQANAALYQNIAKILGKQKPVLLTLDKSFRSTRQIVDFSACFLGGGASITSCGRDGEQPVLYEAADSEKMCDQIEMEVDHCLVAGYQSVGLVCKTEGEAADVYRRLHRRIEMRLIGTDEVGELAGVSVMPVYMAKGLEFDAVLVCGADQRNYHSEDDRRLLHIACTRALHRLSLFGEGRYHFLDERGGGRE